MNKTNITKSGKNPVAFWKLRENQITGKSKYFPNTSTCTNRKINRETICGGASRDNAMWANDKS